MRICYANNKVERAFSNYRKLQQLLPYEWVKTIKKHIDRLRAAEYWSDFLTIGLGKLEQLTGYKNPTFSLHIIANVRLIFELQCEVSSKESCDSIIIIGVCDYHGTKNNWYIP